MKTAPITYTEMAIGAGVLVLGYLAWRAYSAVPKTLAETVEIAAKAVDARKPDQNPNELSLGGIQQAVSDAVQRGQDAGASNFVTAYFTGLFK